MRDKLAASRDSLVAGRAAEVERARRRAGDTRRLPRRGECAAGAERRPRRRDQERAGRGPAAAGSGVALQGSSGR